MHIYLPSCKRESNILKIINSKGINILLHLQMRRQLGFINDVSVII